MRSLTRLSAEPKPVPAKIRSISRTSIPPHPSPRQGLVKPRVLADARRQVLDGRTPGALVAAERKHELLALGEEAVVDPVLGVRLAVEGRALDVDGLVGGVEVDVADGGRVARLRVRDIDALEERRDDEVHVLPRVGEQAHHGERHERTHRTTVIVTREALGRRVEISWDIEVGAVGRQSGPAGVVVLEHGQERGLVSDVCNVTIMQEVEPVHELRWAAVEADQVSLIVWDEEAVFPDTALKGLVGRILKRADGASVIDIAAPQRVLEIPRLIQELRLEESDVASICAIGKGRCLVTLI